MRCLYCTTETCMRVNGCMLEFDHSHCQETKTWQGQVDTTVITDAAREELDAAGAAGVIEEEEEEERAAGTGYHRDDSPDGEGDMP